MHDFFYHGIWRMDWGFGNPNKTAALIVVLMIGIWSLDRMHRGGFWLALLGFTLLGFGLVHTFSRGVIIALLAGMVPVILYEYKRWHWIKICCLVASIITISAYAVSIRASERYAQGINEDDHSITHRLEVWSAAPSMMADAPGGWGIGNSGRAYMQWYQPLDRSEIFRTLVNSHLTWLVEVSWPLRFFYVFLLILILIWSWPGRHNLNLPIYPFGIWIAFIVAATFSSIAESILIWIIPILSLATISFWRIRNRNWISRSSIGLICLLSLIIVGGFWIVGHHAASKIHYLGDGVVVGRGGPVRYILINQDILGQSYGRILREYLAHHNALGTFVLSKDVENSNYFSSIDTLVLAGKFQPDSRIISAIKVAQHTLFLNPQVSPQELSISEGDHPQITVLRGEYATNLPLIWRTFRCEQIDGAGNFMPGWPHYIERSFDSK